MKLEKLYFESSPESILALNKTNQVANASEVMLKSTGNLINELTGASFLNFISESEKSEAETFLQHARIGEKQIFQWKTANGEFKEYRFKMNAKTEDGSILKMEDPGALNNKWGKKLVNEQILQLLLNLIPFPLFVKNAASEYVLLNQAQADLFGLTMEEMIGKSDGYYIKDEKELEMVKKSDKEVFDTFKKTTLPEQPFTTPNGKVYILETIKVPFTNDVTGETNILGVSIDNTEKKLAEAELLKTNHERDEFVSKVTNDLNTALLPIIGILTSSDENKYQSLETSISYVSGLINEMAVYAKN